MACRDDCGMCGTCQKDLEWERDLDEMSRRLGHDQDHIPVYSNTEDSYDED